MDYTNSKGPVYMLFYVTITRIHLIEKCTLLNIYRLPNEGISKSNIFYFLNTYMEQKELCIYL